MFSLIQRLIGKKSSKKEIVIKKINMVPLRCQVKKITTKPDQSIIVKKIKKIQ